MKKRMEEKKETLSGHNLKEGEYCSRNLSEKEIWSMFDVMFSAGIKRSSSYKFGFLKAILDNIYNVDDDMRLSFELLFGKFAEIYWNLVLRYGIRQMPVNADRKETTLERHLKSAVLQFDIADGMTFEAISEDAKKWVTEKVESSCKKNVVGALYGDSQGYFYSFSIKEKWIKINPPIYDFLTENHALIEKVNYYEWARYLEKINPEDVTCKLLDKLDNSAKRTNLSVYRNILYNEFGWKSCFYCDHDLNIEDVQVDHFFPWSLVKDDQLWNLVISCSSCNFAKSNSIPDELLLEKILNNNKCIVDSGKEIDKMKNYKKEKMIRMYEGLRSNSMRKIWKGKSR